MMTRLCFGTYAKALQKALRQPNTNQEVVNLLLELITKNANPNDIGPNFSIKPKMVSEWFSLQRDINKEIVALASSPQVIASAQRGFSDRVVVCLVPNLILDLISELCELVQGDNTISSEQKDALLLNASKDTLSDFLSATFLYALHKPNKLSLDSANTEIATELAPSPADIDNLKKILSQFKPPDRLPIPPNPIDAEMDYIRALLAAYAERDLYQGYKVVGIDCTPGSEGIEFDDGQFLYRGKAFGDIDENIIKRAQIRRTIESHLEKELRYTEKGIKVLSLFFIDEVAKYRTADGDQGIYAEMFEECYVQLLALPKMNTSNSDIVQNAGEKAYVQMKTKIGNKILNTVKELNRQSHLYDYQERREQYQRQAAVNLIGEVFTLLSRSGEQQQVRMKRGDDLSQQAEKELALKLQNRGAGWDR